MRIEEATFKAMPAHLQRLFRQLPNPARDEVVELFPRGAGAKAPVTTRNSDKFRSTYGAFAGKMEDEGGPFYDGLGSASRFFYCAKTTRQDRNEGCEHIPAGSLHWSAGSQNPGSFQGAGTSRESPNDHPTVKPTPLMRYLCRLVTPPGGKICDPFIGSGSTGKGAVLEGFGILGCDNDPHSIEIACARIEFARKQGFQPGLELDRLAA